MADVLVSFPAADRASANQLARDLAATLQYETPSLEIEQVRDDPEAQDFGATLAIILGTAAAGKVAKGFADWVNRHHDATVVVTRRNPDGSSESITVSGDPSRGSRELVRFLESS
jgi:hypothetical protein